MQTIKIVKPHKIQYYCDDCDVVVSSAGITLHSNPPKYLYKCLVCDKVYVLDDIYPRIEWLETD